MQRDAVGAPLIGRSDEIRVLEELVDEIATGQGRFALIEGEPGIGKTTLVDAVVASARQRGLEVRRAAARPLERDRPWGVLLEALQVTVDSREPELARIARSIFDATGSSSTARDPHELSGLRFKVVDDLVELVERLSARAPLVVVLDDLQWADTATLETLDRLLARVAYLPLGVIAACRPVPRREHLKVFAERFDETGKLRVVLPPLDQEQVARLVEELLGAAPGPKLLEHLRRAGGNPLYVAELVRAWEEEQAIELVEGRAEISEASLPPSLALTILNRLSHLSDQTLELLSVASVLGSSFSAEELALIVERPGSDLFSSLREAIAADVLRGDGVSLLFRHDVVREALYEDLPHSLRQALHLQAGRAFARADADPAVVARHLALGASPGDAESIDWLRRAATAYLHTSPGESVALLERAVELAGDRYRERPHLIVSLIEALVAAGLGARAERLARDLLGGVLPELEGKVRLLLCQALLHQGKHVEAAAEGEAAAIEIRLSVRERIRALIYAAESRLLAGEINRAVELLEREDVLAASRSDPLAHCWSLATKAAVRGFQGYTREGLELASRLRKIVATSQNEETRLFHYQYTLGTALLQADRVNAAQAVLSEGLREGEKLGVITRIPRLMTGLGACRFYLGRWDDAVVDIETGLSLADEVQSYGLVLWASAYLCAIAINRGEISRAEQILRASESWVETAGHQYDVDRMHWARALLFESRGDLGRAVASMERTLELNAASGVAMHYRFFGPDFVRLALRVGRRDKAREVSENVEEVTRRSEIESVCGVGVRCRGLLDDDPDLLLEAVDLLARGERLLDVVSAREDAARALARAGKRQDAVTHLQAALEAYEGMGAVEAVTRIQRALASLGVSVRKRGSRRPRQGWESLTKTELAVTELVAEGLSNPEIGERLFISRRTVQTHIAHIFAKLGVSSRSELAALAARRIA